MNAHSALVPVPCSLLFAAKIERRGRSDRDEGIFFPLVTIAASQLNFLRKQQKKTLWHPMYRTSFLRCTMCKKKNPSFKILQRNMRT